jgi:hypothetical protein
MVMVKMPSNFRSGKGAVMLAATRARTLYKTSMKFQSHPPVSPYLNRKRTAGYIPSFAELNVRGAIVLPQGNSERSIGIKSAIVKADTSL